jgi:hypothetical protein
MTHVIYKLQCALCDKEPCIAHEIDNLEWIEAWLTFNVQRRVILPIPYFGPAVSLLGTTAAYDQVPVPTETGRPISGPAT